MDECDCANVQGGLERAQYCIVEGVGGFRVPLVPGWDTADLTVDLGLPVVLVVGIRLGCINHALRTAQGVRACGLALVGWIANTVDGAVPYLPDNLAALADARDRLQAPCWGHVPRLTSFSPAAAAAHLIQPLQLAFLQAS